MSEQRAVPHAVAHAVAHAAGSIDASELPDVAFGHRDLVFLGTTLFVVIEGFTLVVCAVVWIYLAQFMKGWPPPGTARPSWLPTVIQLFLMLLSLPLVRWLRSSARRFDLARTRTATALAALFTIAFVALRFAELRALNVRWDTNAYGSAQWLVVGAHGMLVLMQCVETCGVALMFRFSRLEHKHFSDADDVGFYWLFVVMSWFLLAPLCYGYPRLG